MRRVRWTKTADNCMAVLTPEQRRAILRIVANIQLEPAPDNWVKFTLYELGAMYTLYLDNQQHWAMYHVDGDVVTIVGVGVGGPYVPLQSP